jgi:sortase A
VRDKRPVDELSIEELERILAIKKREERQRRMQRMQRDGRVLAKDATVEPTLPLVAQTAPQPLTPSPSPTEGRGEKDPPPQTFERNMAEGENGKVEGSKAELSRPELPRAFRPTFEDDPADVAAETPEARRAWKTFVNRLLLLVEVAAVLGLVYLGYIFYQSIGTLERESASAAALADEQRRAGIPTIAPTPQIQLSLIVLPSGHTAPDRNGSSQFNLSEIPANLLPLVQSELLTPVISRPPPTDETAVRLIVPKLNLDQTIVQGVDWDALRQGIGQMPNNSNPADARGNVVLAAHNDIYGEYFRYLDQLAAGDQFQIQTRSGQFYTYTIVSQGIYQPTDVSVMDIGQDPMATLVSCYPYQVDNKRIVVFAQRNA